MANYSNGFGSIFRQAFVSNRGNLADALFAIADAIEKLGSRPTNCVDKVPQGAHPTRSDIVGAKPEFVIFDEINGAAVEWVCACGLSQSEHAGVACEHRPASNV